MKLEVSHLRRQMDSVHWTQHFYFELRAENGFRRDSNTLTYIQTLIKFGCPTDKIARKTRADTELV